MIPFLDNARDLEVVGFILGVIFWVQMIRHCATRPAPPMEKYGWILFMILLPPIGSVLYFFLHCGPART